MAPRAVPPATFGGVGVRFMAAGSDFSMVVTHDNTL